ncbi:MAG: hypothetical protein U0174_11540 [Polyangiaceae bacterium]
MRKVAFPLSLFAVGFSIACGSEGPETEFQDVSASAREKPGSSGGTSGSLSSGGTSSSSSSSSGGAGGCGATLAQPTKPKVDIIFVIDNSGSMTGEMVQIRTNVNAFASKIGQSGLDYTVMFIVKKATSPAQTGNVICVPAPLGGANCTDNPPLFHHLDKSVGSTNSLSILQSEYATGINWSSHLRADSTKVFVEVTDDNSSVSDTAFDAFLLSKAPMFGTEQKRNYIFHSIVGWTEGTLLTDTSMCNTAAGNGMTYRKLSTLTGGIVDSVCKTDYSGVLDNMAKGIVDRLACTLGIPTSAQADPTKMVVQVTPPNGSPKTLTQVTDISKCASIQDAWYYDDNAAPKQIILCKSTCEASNGSKVEALVGCKAPDPK